jgi:AraC family transcriptional regulator
MTPVNKALWYIESHFAEDIALDEIARVSGASRFYLTRAFGEATGHSIMRYVRARRLTEAARSLCAGASDILTVALDAGYGSHEAFTRAFRDQFGLTPECLRAQRHLDNLELVEPIKMDETIFATLEAPRFENGKPLLIAGLVERYDCETTKAIPAQWQKFIPHIGTIPGQTGTTTYICGVEVTSFSALPAEFGRVRIPQQRYAVFRHRDHVSTIRRTVTTIWNKWLPDSDFDVADAPNFERYQDFDQRNGTGIIEIWIPLKA